MKDDGTNEDDNGGNGDRMKDESWMLLVEYEKWHNQKQKNVGIDDDVVDEIEVECYW